MPAQVESCPLRMELNQPTSHDTWIISWSGRCPDHCFHPVFYVSVLAGQRRSASGLGVCFFVGLIFMWGFFFSFFDAVKFRKSQGFFLTTPVCDSGIVLVYIDLFIKLLLPAEKTDISLISYFVPCMFEHCCLWLSTALLVPLSCLTWEELWIQDANALQAEE